MERVWRTAPPLRAISCSGACQPEEPPGVAGVMGQEGEAVG
jgi:hypothetical protein